MPERLKKVRTPINESAQPVHALSLIDHLEIPVLVINPALKIIKANNAFYQTFNIDWKKGAKQSLLKLGDGQFAKPQLRDHFKRLFSKMPSKEYFEFRVNIPEIGQRSFLLYSQSAQDITQTGESLIYISFHDITERLKIESVFQKIQTELRLQPDVAATEIFERLHNIREDLARLREAHDILEQFFSNTQILIAYLDTDFNFIRVNNAYANADKKSPDFFTGKNHFDLYPHEENKRIFHQVLKTGTPYSCYAKPFVYPNDKKKTITYWDWSLQPVKNKAGEVEGLLLSIIDATERKNAELELLNTQNDLAKAKRLSDLGTLAATIAHELRNPLSVIRTATYNIKQKSKKSSLSKHLDNIDKKTEESIKIINNILSYSRIKMPQCKNISLSKLLVESINAVKSAFPDKKIVIEKNFSSLKRTKTKADPIQLAEVFTNVLNNAFEAIKSKEGKITVAGGNHNGNLIISFTDTGIGIDRDKIKNLFTPFFTTKIRGTGLGLCICREIVELHNGAITIKSKKGKGTIVTISLPQN